MKKVLLASLFIFGSFFLKPNSVLATCDVSRCDCTEHPIVNTPCSPSYCEVRSPLIGNSGGNPVVVYYCGTAKAGGTGGNDAVSKPPSDWLKNVNPGFTPPWGANFGLDFFTKQLVPFLIWAGVFFTIILSLVFLLVGGIMWITSGGNKEGMAKAKATVTYALVGLVLGLSSVIILRFLENFFLPS